MRAELLAVVVIIIIGGGGGNVVFVLSLFISMAGVTFPPQRHEGNNI